MATSRARHLESDTPIREIPLQSHASDFGIKREIRRSFPYRSYGKASIFTGLLPLFGGVSSAERVNFRLTGSALTLAS